MGLRVIDILVGGQRSKATLYFDVTQKPSLIIKYDGSVEKTYTGSSLFICLSEARRDAPEVQFLCKGAKRNVYPSRMCAEMSGGLMAYELTLGKQARREDIVNIFDVEEVDIVSNPKDQADFFLFVEKFSLKVIFNVQL